MLPLSVAQIVHSHLASWFTCSVIWRAASTTAAERCCLYETGQSSCPWYGKAGHWKGAGGGRKVFCLWHLSLHDRMMKEFSSCMPMAKVAATKGCPGPTIVSITSAAYPAQLIKSRQAVLAQVNAMLEQKGAAQAGHA